MIQLSLLKGHLPCPEKKIVALYMDTDYFWQTNTQTDMADSSGQKVFVVNFFEELGGCFQI